MTDPFPSNVDGTATAVDDFDPFGNTQPEDLRSHDGPLLPFPHLPDMDKRLVVMEPFAFDPKAKDPNNPGKTRELFMVRLTVLAGEPMQLSVRKENPVTKVWEDTGETIEAGGDEHPWPLSWGKFSVPQQSIVGQLKGKFDVTTGQPKDGGFLLGVVRRCPRKKNQPAHLDTPDKIDAALRAHGMAIAAGRNSTEPLYTWKITNYTPEQKAIALHWYRNRNS